MEPLLLSSRRNGNRIRPDQDGHSHIVSVDAEKGAIVIDRLHSHGERVLYTEIPYSKFIDLKEQPAFDDFCQKLGESIALDSPGIRALFDL